MQNQFFHKDIVSSLKPIEPVSLFKIFGEEFFSFESALAPSLVDWSGFYTQLTPEHSLRYLTKKWSDGADFGCLLSLTPVNPNIRLLQVQHLNLASPKISGQEKALNIKKHLSQQYQQLKEVTHHLLVDFLGKHLIILKCIDSEDQQYIIPHQMLNHKNFTFKHCMHFKKSQDGVLRTINYRFSGRPWVKVANNYQFQPYLMLTDEQIKTQLEQILAKNDSL